MIFLTTLKLILKCGFDPWSDLKLCTPSWQTWLSLQFVDLWCNVGRLSTFCLVSPLQHQGCHCLTDLTLTVLTRVIRMTKVTEVTIVTRPDQPYWPDWWVETMIYFNLLPIVTSRDASTYENMKHSTTQLLIWFLIKEHPKWTKWTWYHNFYILFWSWPWPWSWWTLFLLLQNS